MVTSPASARQSEPYSVADGELTVWSPRFSGGCDSGGGQIIDSGSQSRAAAVVEATRTGQRIVTREPSPAASNGSGPTRSSKRSRRSGEPPCNGEWDSGPVG